MIKIINSPNYNYKFNTENGYFIRWGKTLKDDPEFSPLGPEILDIEISTICHGIGKICEFCYKSNTPIGSYMTIENFEKLFSKIPTNTNQIAFGIGSLSEKKYLRRKKKLSVKLIIEWLFIKLRIK